MTTTRATILLEFRTEIAAPPERVFAALTEAGHLARWFCDRAESTPGEGGPLTLRWDRPGASPQPFEGRWVAFEKPTSCAWVGGHSGYPAGDAGRVDFALEAGGPGTILVTRHRLSNQTIVQPIAERYRAAWPRALARLSQYLAATR